MGSCMMPLLLLAPSLHRPDDRLVPAVAWPALRLLTGGWLTRYRHSSPMYWNTVTLCLWQSSQNWLAENLGFSTTVAPAEHGDKVGRREDLAASPPYRGPAGATPSAGCGGRALPYLHARG